MAQEFSEILIVGPWGEDPGEMLDPGELMKIGSQVALSRIKQQMHHVDHHEVGHSSMLQIQILRNTGTTWSSWNSRVVGNASHFQRHRT